VVIVNGYTITYEDGQYAVNLVGANSNVADNVNVNQVSVRSANSAGLVQTREIEQAAFGDQVTIWDSASNLLSGTAYPMGTLNKPCRTLDDALFIANLRSIDKIHVTGTLTIPALKDIGSLNFIGNGTENSKLILTETCRTSKTTFRDITVSGWQDGETHYYDCEIKALSGVHCKFVNCLLVGPMKMEEGSFVDTTVLVDCYTGWDKTIVAPALKDEFVVDLNNSSINMVFNNFHGKIKFINLNHATAAGTIAVNMGAGKVTIDSSCTRGTIKIRGNGEVVDNSTGTSVDNDVTAMLVATLPEMASLISANSVGTSGGLTNEQTIMLTEIYKLMGLDPTKPLIVTETGRSVSTDIEQSFVTDDINKVTTVTRL
jgi:hypothetical protein